MYLALFVRLFLLIIERKEKVLSLVFVIIFEAADIYEFASEVEWLLTVLPPGDLFSTNSGSAVMLVYNIQTLTSPAPTRADPLREAELICLLIKQSLRPVLSP